MTEQPSLEPPLQPLPPPPPAPPSSSQSPVPPHQHTPIPPNNTASLQFPQPPQKPPSSPSPFRRPPIRLTTEYDSEKNFFSHKVSSKFFHGLAKLKFSFLSSHDGDITNRQVSLVTKNLSVDYDVEDRDAVVRGVVDVGKHLKLTATHFVKKNKNSEMCQPQLGIFTRCISLCCYVKEQNALLRGLCRIGSSLQLRASHDFKAQRGEVGVIVNLGDPAYKLELSSVIPSTVLQPKATLRIPFAEVSLEEGEDAEEKRILLMNALARGSFMNGVCTASYSRGSLDLRYLYKDEEMTFIPSISLPSNTSEPSEERKKILRIAFKRRFGPSSKLSYKYDFDSNYWTTIYKHTIGKNSKLKVGYDSGQKLSSASLWVGDDHGKAKTSPLKVNFLAMLHVPDNIKSSYLMFWIKKRWDI